MHFAAAETKNNRRDNAGSVLLTMLAIILAVLYLGVLVIDLSRVEYLTRVIQRSVDAASLAGATELVLSSGDAAERWKNAKRVTLGVLRTNLAFSGYEIPNLNNPSNHKSYKDKCEQSGAYRSQIFDDGAIRIQLARGTYLDSASGTFSSLENPSECKDDSYPPPNAVRVTVTVRELPLFFGVFAGITSGRFGPVTRSAIGARID